MSNHPIAVEEAAVELRHLINSRSTSPGLDEIAAIVAKVLPAPQYMPAQQGGISIGALAEALTAMWRIRGELDSESIACSQTRKGGVLDGDLLRRSWVIRGGEREIGDYMDALETAMLRLEPQTPADVLSLALLLKDQLDVFLPNAVNADRSLDQAADTLERGIAAVVRGLALRLGLQSPLLCHWTVPPEWDKPQQTDSDIDDAHRELSSALAIQGAYTPESTRVHLEAACEPPGCSA